ncbi:glycosyltransferase family 39 protein [Bradyrhizobium manausense]|uniref:ArnT family glycosyltransferase n=1 Tax=Bradyrhizobium TaxID=374 RepID=UPI001BA95E12|nr:MULTISPECIES: glycosyltransferase family 39 protein [Bradyrhizobium]MBR0824159.1 glycosyltransferase family 39 protein [Bradyrhizobium manausense]UVO26567.1 glycosyltransferase family 39 protein [Bradyrhizobium arachidis]
MSQAIDSTAVTQIVWTWFLRQVERVREAEIPGWVWVVLLWALMAFPAASLRGTHYEEGTVIGLARGALEDGQWRAPHLYGLRFVERPVLLSWIAAAFGSVTGGVGVWSARLPHLLFLLAGGLMVYHLVLPHTRRAPAVFGALCWFACPMVAQKFVTAEPDVTLSVLMFGGFFLWWRGVIRGNVSLPRWICIGILLALSGLTKGPQPLAFFGLGVGAYILIKRRWGDVAGFVLANAIAVLPAAAWYWMVMIPGDVEGWLHHSRLAEGMTASQWLRDHLDFALSMIMEWAPGSVLLIPAIIAMRRNELPGDRDLMLAAILYATLGGLVLLVWPGGVATRYAMPGNLGLAVIGGILFERWWFSRHWLIAVANTVVIGLSTALIVFGWIVIPAAPDIFRQSRIDAQIIAGVRATMPGTIYAAEMTASANVLAYVPAPLRRLPAPELARLKAPALAIISPAEMAALAAANPALRIVSHARLSGKPPLMVVEIRPNAAAGHSNAIQAGLQADLVADTGRPSKQGPL